MEGLRKLNKLEPGAAQAELLRCCGSAAWAKAMAGLRPFPDAAALHRAAEEAWARLGRADWLEAFAAHPRIGARARGWAKGEQAGAVGAPESVLEKLAAGNRDYEARFGHIFIVCATGKSAAEMLGLLKARLGNAPEAELKIAAGEQAKITRIRLEKLIKP